jgi:iron(III) transport system ATP-binding protein
MEALELRNIVKKFGKVVAVNDVSLRVKKGEFIVLLGPSGCGKTTILRMIAGFLRLDEGSIWMNGKEVSSKNLTWPPNLRDLSMVFQNYAIWPHMTVFDNVAYGLKIRKTSRADLAEQVMRALRIVQIEGLAKRFSHELSGGQQQRVALARALVVNPTILLMDEPLSNLDAKLRIEMRSEIRDLHRRLNYTTIYVTHDQTEALALGDRIILMDGGRIIQEGKPEDLYQFPNSCFSALFLGVNNLIRGSVQSVDPISHELFIASPSGFSVKIKNTDIPISEFHAGDKVVVSIRGAAVNVFKNPPTGTDNLFQGSIARAIFLGDYYDYEVKVGELSLNSRCGANQRFEIHEQVYVGFPSEAAGVCCFKDK